MKTKLIGFTARILYEDGVRKQFVNERYLTPFITQGFNTIMLTCDNEQIEDVLALCDAFVITGGADIDPKYFNEENLGESKNVDNHLDELDKAVVEYAYKHQKPLLGICRGHQAINVFLGGSLYQNIGTSHSNTKHIVKATSNRLFNFPQQFETNSYHHQALKAIAPDLEVYALATDNTVEAVIHKELPIMGFQFHPEVWPNDPISIEIFHRFAELIRK